ncbi:hypothetical protein ACH5RR_009932 [Cinchona calisaya]|uniref:RBR-type E3 ubiquitin transferase n=1 Tax=Cinchona calisaya TaxID=153742 RepID=A0ABD3AI86_9GENT
MEVSEQRRELTDFLFAYQLQMQEAMNASLSPNNGGGGVASSSNPTFDAVSEEFEAFTIPAQLLSDEISNDEQQLLDHHAAEEEMKKIRNDLNRRIHDHAFAREILRIPEEEWRRIGDNIEKPYNQGSTAARGGVVKNEDCFRVHVKGLMGGEISGNAKRGTFVGGIGVAICDMEDRLVFEVSKGVVGSEMNGEVVEVKALIEGLHVATILGLKRILIVSDSNLLYQYITGKWGRPKQSNVALLVDQVTLLQRNLTHCNLSLVAQKDVKFAFKLAQDAIVSQSRQQVENNCGKRTIETCAICLEDVNTNRMFSIEGCLHRYCFSCMRKHVEVQLLQGRLPKCPHQECKSQLKKDDCRKFLTPELLDIMSELIMEASISPANKIYCPYPLCSALMSRSDYVSGCGTLVNIKCRKCRHSFCMDCKVPWHENMTCYVYQKQNPYLCTEDAKLKSLATRSRWRHCGKCNHLVSLAEGCNHIYCRCGHEFCYICGAAWKNKKATCNCPLWDERKIICDNRNRPQQRGG